MVRRSLKILVDLRTRSIFPDFARLVAEPVELVPPLFLFFMMQKILKFTSLSVYYIVCLLHSLLHSLIHSLKN